MKKLKQVAGILAISAFLMFSYAPVYAQDADRTTTTTTDVDDDDDDRDYGWIGLLGLAGLAGLLKRDKDKHVHVDTDRRTTGGTTGTTNR